MTYEEFFWTAVGFVFLVLLIDHVKTIRRMRKVLKRARQDETCITVDRNMLTRLLNAADVRI